MTEDSTEPTIQSIGQIITRVKDHREGDLGVLLNCTWSRCQAACLSCGVHDRPHAGNGLCLKCYTRNYRKTAPLKKEYSRKIATRLGGDDMIANLRVANALIDEFHTPLTTSTSFQRLRPYLEIAAYKIQDAYKDPYSDGDPFGKYTIFKWLLMGHRIDSKIYDLMIKYICDIWQI